MTSTKYLNSSQNPANRKTQVTITHKTRDSREGDAEGPTTAVQAIRYLFLARELQRLGEPHAADRWQAKAMAWLQRFPGSLEN